MLEHFRKMLEEEKMLIKKMFVPKILQHCVKC
jgi:hypothetical protein